MRSLKLLSLFLFSITALQAQQVKFSDLQPEAGRTVSFIYDPKGTTLENTKSIKCEVFLFDSKSPRVESSPKTLIISLVKDAALYKATLHTTDSTSLIALYFYTDSINDNNPNSYYTKLYHHGTLNASAYANEGYLLTTFGQHTLGTRPDLERGVAAYEQAFILDPALKKELLYDYLLMSYRLDKKDGIKLISEYIEQISSGRPAGKPALTKLATYHNPTNNKDLSLVTPEKIAESDGLADHSKQQTNGKPASEKDMIMVYRLYNMLGEKDSAYTAKNRIFKYYPTGREALFKAEDSLNFEKNAILFEGKWNALIAKFKLDENKKEDKRQIVYMYPFLAKVYGENGNKEKFEFYANKISNKITLANTYNSFASILIDKNENIAYAAEIYRKSIDLIVAAKSEPAPNYYTANKYMEKLDNYYAMYSGNYAVSLYKLGKYKEAVAYEEQALALTKNADIGMHKSYHDYLEKAGQPEKALAEDEIIIKNGGGTDSTRNDLKILYTELGKKGDYKAYLSKLDSAGAVHEKEEWQKKMTNIPAPAFTLMNLKGQKISLSDYKGKIVILDYWATWCGPCKSTFPGMQKAINKYKGNPNVVFLFINTWQTEEFREKAVKDYMNSTKYTFNVLLDTQNKNDAADFEVVNLYKVNAIPTKFVIDSKGSIRLKMTGASNDDDEVVKEIDTMIAMASS